MRTLFRRSSKAIKWRRHCKSQIANHKPHPASVSTLKINHSTVVLILILLQCINRVTFPSTTFSNNTSTFTMSQQHMKVAMMTSGGLAPCLSASIAQLVRYWSAALKEGKIASLSIRMYLDGYKGILIGDSFLLDEALWEECDALNYLGGSPIGNSRVKVGTYRQT